VRIVVITLGVVIAVSLALGAAARALINNDGPTRNAVIRYARCHYDRRTDRVIAMASLTNPNDSAVPFAIGAHYLVQQPEGHGGLGHRRWSMIGVGVIPDRHHRRTVTIPGKHHLWWVARTRAIRHQQESGERVLCQFFGSAPPPANAGEHD
jgi:hypothetical protein